MQLLDKFWRGNKSATPFCMWGFTLISCHVMISCHVLAKRESGDEMRRLKFEKLKTQLIKKYNCNIEK